MTLLMTAVLVEYMHNMFWHVFDVLHEDRQNCLHQTYHARGQGFTLPVAADREVVMIDAPHHKPL